MKKIIIIILSVLLAIPSFTAVCSADADSELPEVPDGAEEMMSSSDSRADVMALLWWAAGSPEPTLTENPFSDISPDAPYYKAVLWAVENRITAGVDRNHFSPNDPLTRGAALTLLYRASGSPAVEPLDLPYRDVDPHHFYYTALLWAESTSLVDVGTEGDLFYSAAHLYELTAVKSGGSVKYVFHSHKWETASETPATCGSHGEIVLKCSVCGETENVNARFFDHDFISYEIAPTCTADGYTWSFCKLCGYSTFKGSSKSLGHDFGADGKAERCSRCGFFNPALKKSFTDVPSGAFFSSPVEWAVENGITTGTSAVTFSPAEGCTRGQVVTFLWRAAGCPEPAGSNNPFRDVAEGDYFYTAGLWAVENEITKGTSATEFSPGDTCTRGQIVTFLWRASGSPVAEVAEIPFRDVHDGDYFRQAVLWAVKGEITLGTSRTAFSPNDKCTRGQ
ncbi:MAG: S-layer homology domain-containing protein, partial [Clostridia bacterium]|nr:S-layer homology domain-containing protein [Clostridia bacterium]